MYSIMYIVYKTNTFRTSTRYPSYTESNKGIKERQGPTLGAVPFTEVSVKTQLSVYTVRERLSEATIPKGIVGGFKFTVLQKNFKEWHERWTKMFDRLARA